MVVGVLLGFFFSIVILDTSDKSNYDICLSFHHSTCQIRGFVITLYQFSFKQFYIFFSKLSQKTPLMRIGMFLPACKVCKQKKSPPLVKVPPAVAHVAVLTLASLNRALG